MGSIGESLLEKLKNSVLIKEEAATKSASPATTPTSTGCANRGKCMQLGRSSRGFDPLLIVPFSLFGQLEFSLEFLRVARELLIKEVKWPSSITTPADFLVQVQETSEVSSAMQAAFKDTPGHLVTYRIRPQKRQAMESERGASSRALLDNAEYEVNKLVLPRLLRYAEEYRAVKKGQAREALLAKEAEEKAAEEAREIAEMERQEARSGGAHWTAKHEDTTNQVYGPSRLPSQQKCTPAIIGAPRIIGRNGYGEVWHRKPISDVYDDNKLTKSMALKPPSRLTASRSDTCIRRCLSNASDAKAKEISLVGGRLRLKQVGTSICKSENS